MMVRRLALGILLSLAAALRAAETSVPNPQASLTITKPAMNAAWQQRFTLGAGDVLGFSLIGSPELTRTEVVIGPDGRISYLQAHDVVAAGLTIDELRAKFDEELAKYYRSPKTIITPISYRSKKYIILGAVAQKGVFAFDRPITIVEAIGRAGGFAMGPSDRGVGETADLSRSLLVRRGQRVEVDFERLFGRGDLSQNAPVEPDDFLFFPPANLSEIYLLGAVNGPGSVPYQPNMTLIAALSARGGYTDRAWRQRMLVVRGSLNRPVGIAVNAADILAARAPDFKLQPRDIVYVSERPWILAEDLIKTAINAFVNSAFITWAGDNVHIQPPPKD